MLFRKKKHRIIHGYVPWFPENSEEEDHFVNYIHLGLHRETGEDVPFPDSSWSYTRNESPFLVKERSDHEIHFRVLDEMYRNSQIDCSKINVMVHNGIVNLSGSVDSEDDRRGIETLVKEIPEVWNIENELVLSG